MESVSFTQKTIDLAAKVSARAIVIHMGEVPIDLSLQDRLYKLYDGGYSQTKEYKQTKEELIYQRISQAPPTLMQREKVFKSLENIATKRV